MKKYYSVKEVAKLLGLSTNTVYKYLNEGKLASRRFGKGRFKVPAASLTPFLGTEETVLRGQIKEAVPAAQPQEVILSGQLTQAEDHSKDPIKSLQNAESGASAVVITPLANNPLAAAPVNLESKEQPNIKEGIVNLPEVINTKADVDPRQATEMILPQASPETPHLAEPFSQIKQTNPTSLVSQSWTFQPQTSTQELSPAPKVITADKKSQQILTSSKSSPLTTAKNFSETLFIRILVSIIFTGLGLIYLMITPTTFAFSEIMKNELGKFIFALLPYVLIAVGFGCFLSITRFIRTSKTLTIIIHSVVVIILIYLIVISLISHNYGLLVYISGMLGVTLIHLLAGGEKEESFLATFSRFALVVSLSGGIVVLLNPDYLPLENLGNLILMHKGISAFIWYAVSLPPLIYFLLPGKKNQMALAIFFSLGGIISILMANELMGQSVWDVAYISYINGLFAFVLVYWEVVKPVIDSRKVQVVALSFAWIAATLLFGIFAVQSAQVKLKEDIRSTMNSSAGSLVNQVNDTFEQNKSVLVSFTSGDDLKNTVKTDDREKAKDAAKAIYGKIENIRRVLIYDNKGIAIGVYPYNSLAEGVDYSSRDYFQTTQSTYKGTITSVFQSILNANTVMQTEPIFENNVMIGMAGIAYSIDDLGKKYQNSLGDQYSVSIIDKNNIYVYNSDTGTSGEKVKESASLFQDNAKGLMIIEQYANTPHWNILLKGSPSVMMQRFSNIDIVVTVLWIVNGIFSVIAAISLAGERKVKPQKYEEQFIQTALETV